MRYDDPLYATDTPHLYHLAPIPVLMRVFDDHALHDEVYAYGQAKLSETQKRMGQELPERYDVARQASYEPAVALRERWTENTELNPIGSRYFVPPNDFLSLDHAGVKVIRERITSGLSELLDGMGVARTGSSRITESWVQYYDPHAGRGHQKHNHCRWSVSEEPEMAFAGGYYLSDGEPLADHPYSGALCFHLRGMSHFLRPKKGMLMIWPYDIVHSVKPFYGKTERCVINFNVQPTTAPIERLKRVIASARGA
jgi:hypothetical protein